MTLGSNVTNYRDSALVRKPGTCYQTYFSFPSPAPLPNAHAHEEKYGWLARLGLNLVEVSQCSLSYWLFSLFSRHISRTQSFQQNRHIIFPALVALKLLVSLISRLVACSARIVVDRQTDTQTHRTTTVTLAAHARRGLTTTSRKGFTITDYIISLIYILL